MDALFRGGTRMGRSRLISISVISPILLGFFLLMTASAAEQSPWLEIHSAHFTVITDAGDKKGREVALRFEQMRAVFATLLMKERLNEPVPLTILAFRNDKTYYQNAPLRQGQPIGVPAFFVPSDDHNFIVLNLFEEESWRAVSHGFAHLLLNYNYPPVQGWFDEGLAEYFSSIRLDNKQVEIGGDPELQSSFKEDLLQNQRDVRNAPKSHEKKLSETGTYFDLAENQHVPVEEAIQKAYGVTASQFDQAVKDYFHSLKPLFVALDATKQSNSPQSNSPNNAPQVYQFPELVGPNDSVINTKTIPEADARALTAEMKIRIPERRESGLQELQALAASPDQASAKAMKDRDRNKKDDKDQDENDKKIGTVSAVGNEIAFRDCPTCCKTCAPCSSGIPNSPTLMT